jgi:trk system potassium uptake protein
MVAVALSRNLTSASAVCFSVGVVTLIFSVGMLLPLGMAFFDGNVALSAFNIAFWSTVSFGLLLVAVSARGPKELTTRDSYVLVSGIWFLFPVLAGLPFFLFFEKLSFTDAYFEAVAGLTTTGATVLSDLDNLPAPITMWRAVLQWLGGMGIIVLFVALMPLLRVGGRQLYKAEAPGVMKETQVTPRIAQTAKGLWTVYAGITALCAVAYRVAGMSWMDALAHAFTTTSLGGFSTHDASFGFFNSPLLEAIAIVFMLASGINFLTHFVAMSRQSMKPYWADREVGWFLSAIIGGVLIVTVFLWLSGTYSSFATAFRFAAFNVVSIGTTTGYATTDYNLWPAFAPIVMLVLCSTAACAGSTGGGVKMIRTQLLLKQVHRELIRMLHPSAIAPMKIGAEIIPNQVVFAVLGFMTVYGATVILLVLVLLGSGLDLVTAFSAVIACVTSTGPGLNQVGPATNYAVLTDFQTWVCSIAMILGRLEIFTVLVLFSPSFWKR